MTTHGGDIYSHSANILDFSTNVNPFGPFPEILDAAAAALPLMHRYPDPFCRELREAISTMLQISSDNIVCGNGAAELIYLLLQMLSPARVLLPVPCFTEYRQAAESVGAEVLPYILKENQAFRIDRGLLSALTPDIDLLILAQPNNPTGQVISAKLLEEIAQACADSGIALLVDESFLGFTAAGKTLSLLPMLKEKTQGRCFILRSYTKMYAMAGLRLGYLVCSDPQDPLRMGSLTQPWRVSLPAIAAGVCASRLMMQEPSLIQEQMRSFLRTERPWLIEELSALKTQSGSRIKVFPSEANYLLLFAPDIPLQELLLKEGILIRDCKDYQGLSAGYFRIAIRRHEENLRLLNTLQFLFASL